VVLVAATNGGAGLASSRMRAAGDLGAPARNGGSGALRLRPDAKSVGVGVGGGVVSVGVGVKPGVDGKGPGVPGLVDIGDIDASGGTFG